jgi:hypothetical protein
MIGEIDRLPEGRVDGCGQSHEDDRNGSCPHPKNQKDQTAELDKDGQAGGEFRGQQRLSRLGTKQYLRHVEVADLHNARLEEESSDPAPQEKFDRGIAPLRQSSE